MRHLFRFTNQKLFLFLAFVLCVHPTFSVESSLPNTYQKIEDNEHDTTEALFVKISSITEQPIHRIQAQFELFGYPIRPVQRCLLAKGKCNLPFHGGNASYGK